MGLQLLSDAKQVECQEKEEEYESAVNVARNFGFAIFCE